VREHAHVGENCTIGNGVYLDAHVTIGSNVKIQNHVSIFEGVTLQDGGKLVGVCETCGEMRFYL
jgi:UDP-2-acetamido-3-amino-2,3-dideoxy-glucuronate N-acetyltransferase